MTTGTTSYIDGVVDVARRWLIGPPTFCPGSLASGSATEERWGKRWFDDLRRDIAQLRSHPDATPGGRAMLNAIVGPRRMPESVVSTTIVDLGSEQFALRHPLVVMLEFHAGEVVASWPEIEVWSTGADAADAINHLKDAIAEFCADMLDDNPATRADKLRKLPRRWVAALRAVVHVTQRETAAGEGDDRVGP